MTRGLWLGAGAATLVAIGFIGCGDDSGSGGSADGGGSASSSKSASTTVTKSSTSVVASTSSGGTIFVGQVCTGDGQCGPDGRCILPDEDDPRLGGGPADGYCTIACADSSECPGAGVCLIDNGVGECFLGCEIGPELEFIDDELLETKCHQREDVRCIELDDGPACIPTCGSDDQCPGGRVCDPRAAVCVDDPNTGDPDGVACDPDNDTCEGRCVSFTGGTLTMCSNVCVLGGELDGFDCGGLENGVCVFRPSGYGPGDHGFCSPACSVQTDCNNPDWWCFGNTFATNGFCFTATPCPNGQGDCDATDLCTQTQHGPFCLDPAIPLGEGGGGGGGGGMGGAGGAGGAGGQGGQGG